MLDMLWICCTQNNHPSTSGPEPMEVDQQKGEPSASALGTITAPMARHIGLLLIELVAPDVIYNGTPWPEEDFMKVTIERYVGYWTTLCFNRSIKIFKNKSSRHLKIILETFRLQAC